MTEIKALTDVEQILRCVSADGALHVAALFLADDEGGCRGRQQVRGQAGEEAPGPPAHRGPGWDGSRLT